tara:strand:- start:117 stop:512 length:396 start_codon:yes stop_codon:yes gene_type:complete
MARFLAEVIDYIENRGWEYVVNDQQVQIQIPTFLDRDMLFGDFADGKPWKVEVDSTQMPFFLERVLYYDSKEINNEAVEVLGLERTGANLYLCLMPSTEYNEELLRLYWHTKVRSALERGRKDVQDFLNQY